MHSNIHLGLKKIECENCGKKFNKKYNLVVHESSKTGCKRYRAQAEHLKETSIKKSENA
jgi:hypothetical protein